MDKTTRYIKMCKEAKEIQAERVEGLGIRRLRPDDFVAGNFGENLKTYICEDISRYWIIRDELIWLPRQDQLQELLYGHIQQDYGVIADMYDFTKENLEYVKQFRSLEQLWLAFVMKIKYNKIWDDKKEEWIIK